MWRYEHNDGYKCGVRGGQPRHSILDRQHNVPVPNWYISTRVQTHNIVTRRGASQRLHISTCIRLTNIHVRIWRGAGMHFFDHGNSTFQNGSSTFQNTTPKWQLTDSQTACILSLWLLRDIVCSLSVSCFCDRGGCTRFHSCSERGTSLQWSNIVNQQCATGV